MGGGMDITKYIGDYEYFFTDLLNRVKNIGIDVKGFPLSHFTYRTETTEEYNQLREELKSYCDEFVETGFNGRPISILGLRQPLMLEDNFEVKILELAAPRAIHMYPSGLESLGIVIGSDLDEFRLRHHKVITGVKDHGEYCQPAFVTFENDKTFKFYDISLREIVILQGWQFDNTTSTV